MGLVNILKVVHPWQSHLHFLITIKNITANSTQVNEFVLFNVYSVWESTKCYQNFLGYLQGLAEACRHIYLCISEQHKHSSTSLFRPIGRTSKKTNKHIQDQEQLTCTFRSTVQRPPASQARLYSYLLAPWHQISFTIAGLHSKAVPPTTLPHYCSPTKQGKRGGELNKQSSVHEPSGIGSR